MKNKSSPGRIPLLFFLALLAGGILYGSYRLFFRFPPRPGIILLTLDTVRQDHLSVYGYYRDTAPGLEALAREGVVFTRAYTPLPMTQPAHFSLLTAEPPAVHGVLYNGQPCRNQTITYLAAHLGRQGFATAGFMGSGIFRPSGGLKQGFDRFYSNTWRERPKNRKTHLNNYVRGADEVVLLAEDWLRSRDQTRPFFIWLHFWDAHGPYYAPAEYLQRYSSDDPLRAAMQARHQAATFDFQGQTHDTQLAINQYDGAIRFLDDELSGFWKFLRQEQLFDPSLIVVVADHGEGLNEHGYYFHGANIYEEAVRIPLLFRFPQGRHGGKKFQNPVSIMDVAPTLLEAMNLPALPEADGQSLMPIIQGKAEGGDRVLLLETSFKLQETEAEQVRIFGVVDQQWKYWSSPGAEESLFDLEQDPHELTNVRSQHPEPVNRLRRALQTFLKNQPPPAGPAEPLSPEAEKALKALGYIQK